MIEDGMPLRMSGCRGLDEEVIAANFLMYYYSLPQGVVIMRTETHMKRSSESIKNKLLIGT